MNQQLATAVKYWGYIAPIMKYPSNQKEFHELVGELDELLEIVGNNENHRLVGLLDAVSNLIASYEAAHPPSVTQPNKGIDALKYLMEVNHLNQTDLAKIGIGSQGVISEILQGKRVLNIRQIKLLAKRFHVNPATFIDDIEE